MGSRFDFDGSGDEIPYGLWQGALKQALTGKRGHQALLDMEAALLALPEKRLIAGSLVKDGEVCAVGAYAAHMMAVPRKLALAVLEREREWDDEEWRTTQVGEDAGMRRRLAWEFAYRNDEECAGDTPEARYEHILGWVRQRIAMIT